MQKLPPDTLDVVTIGAGHLRYHRWATRRILGAAAALSTQDLEKISQASFGSVLGTLRHIYQADHTWFSRIDGQAAAGLATAPTPQNLQELEVLWGELLEHRIAWAEAMGPTDWLRLISYQNSAGAHFETPVWQIVFQLTNHAAYHRGQVTTMLRELGAQPVNTDLIAFYRSEVAGK